MRHSTQQGLTPKRVTVAISIPSSYYEKVWYEKNPPAAGAPPQKPDATALAEIESKVKGDVESAVVALLPAAGRRDRSFSARQGDHVPAFARPGDRQASH